MIAAFLAQLSVIYVPAFQWVFRTVPITVNEWVQILMVSTTIILVVEMDKWIRGRKPKETSLLRT
jgi:Ca2+-transporting ATPase